MYYNAEDFIGTAYMQEQQSTMRTAFLTAFPKVFTGIPYAGRIFDETVRIACNLGFNFKPEHFVAKMAVELEARHSALSAAIKRQIEGSSKKSVIVELAVGLSPRRLEFNNYPYIEIDFPPMMQIKSKIYETLGRSGYTNELIGADLTDQKDLSKIADIIQREYSDYNIIFVSEGLFWYLSRESVEILAKSVYEILSEVGGLWVTGDCPPEGDQFKGTEYLTVIAKSSDRKMDEPFASFSNFNEFFTLIGFNVKNTKLESWIEPSDLIAAAFFSSDYQDTLSRIRTYTDIAELSVSE